MTMTSPDNKSLIELSRDYYRGLLSFEDYRDRRRRLIGDLTGEDVIAVDAESQWRQATDVVDSPPGSAAGQEDRAAGGKRTGWRFLIRLLAIGLLLAVAGVAGWWALYPVDDAQEFVFGDEEAIMDSAGGAFPEIQSPRKTDLQP
jgi:hypothetical protein